MQKKDTSDSEKTEVENVADTSESNEDENDSKPTRDLNHLSNTEASFGEIDKPLYKKGEKELKLPIIIYHEFETPVPEDDIYKLYSTEARFEENVTTLLDAGYTFITLEDLYKYDQGYIGLPEKNVIITIDLLLLNRKTHISCSESHRNTPCALHFTVQARIFTKNMFHLFSLFYKSISNL